MEPESLLLALGKDRPIDVEKSDSGQPVERG
jgi:hypothetical protein